MFGRLPWLAFERRMRALRFLVFFDIRDDAIGQSSLPHLAYETGRQRARPSEYGSPVTLVFEQTYRFPFFAPVPNAPSGAHHEPGFTSGNAPATVVDVELGVAGATVPTGPALVDAAFDPHDAMVALGQFLVRMFLARPHSLGSMDNFQ